MNQSVDVRRALLHVFDDPEWLNKSIIGGLASLILGLNFAAIGYEVQTIRNVWRGEARPMPRWDDFGSLFTDGLRLGLARLALGLPLIVLVMVPAVAFALLVPLVPLLAGSEADVEQVATGVLGLSLLGGGLLCGFGMLLGLMLSFVSPAMAANYTRQGTFAACFDLKEIARLIRENGGNYIRVWLAGVGAGFAMNLAILLLYWIPCIGWLLTFPITAFGIFYILMVTGHGVGQLLRLEDARNAAPAALPAAT